MKINRSYWGVRYEKQVKISNTHLKVEHQLFTFPSVLFSLKPFVLKVSRSGCTACLLKAFFVRTP